MVWNWKQTFCLSMLVALWQPGQVRVGLLLVGMIERGADSLLYLFHLQVKHKLPCLTSYKFYGSETPESRKREKKMLSIKFWYFYHTWSQHLPPLFCIHHSVGENFCFANSNSSSGLWQSIVLSKDALNSTCRGVTSTKRNLWQQWPGSEYCPKNHDTTPLGRERHWRHYFNRVALEIPCLLLPVPGNSGKCVWLRKTTSYWNRVV